MTLIFGFYAARHSRGPLGAAMESIILCVNAILPIFIMIALGALARFKGLLGVADVLKMNKIAFSFFMPFMMFNNIYTAELGSALRPRLIGFTVGCVVVIFLLSTAFTLLFTGDNGKRGVIIQGLFRSNYVIVGMPIAASLVPGADLSSVAILVAIVVAVFNVLAVVGLSLFNDRRVGLRGALRGIATNPLILSSALGVAFLLTDARLPAFLESAVGDLSGVGSPLMLFLLGAFIDFRAMKGFKRELICVCVGRLLVIPAVFLSIGYLAGFRGIEFAALIGAFASSSAATSFTMAQQMGGNSELAGDIVIFTSALCPFTLFIWCTLFTSLGAI